MPARDHEQPSDSAGTPWAGRHFDESPASDDDGSAPPALIRAIEEFHAGAVGESAVVDVFRESRLLVPIVAELGESGLSASGLLVDKSAELSIVTVEGPDGRPVLPVFSSVEAMARWNPKARPVPADAVRVALAAASESTELVVLDPVSATEVVLRRPAVWAVAQGLPWQPSHTDPAVLAEFRRTTVDARVLAVAIEAGDPGARLAGPALIVAITIEAGLSAADLTAMLAILSTQWGSSELIAERVDSLTVRFLPET